MKLTEQGSVSPENTTGLDDAARQLADAQRRLGSAQEEVAAKSARIGALSREVETLRHLLDRSRDREQQLLDELSKERRESLRLLQEGEEHRRAVEDELRSLRAAPTERSEDEPPRHSVIYRRSSRDQMAAETVRPPPVSKKA